MGGPCPEGCIIEPRNARLEETTGGVEYNGGAF